MLDSIETHTHNRIDSKGLDPQFFFPVPVFSTVPSAADAPANFLYINGATYRIYFRRDNAGTAELYYVALTKV